MNPEIHNSESEELGSILRLIQASFAYMDGRIDPPSSMHRLTLADIVEHCSSGEVWTVGDPITGCMFLTPKVDSLYIGKLAVCDSERGKGIARRLVEHAEGRAAAQGKSSLELYTRIELTENQLAFSKLGFKKVSKESHPGFKKPTYIVMRKLVSH